MRELIASNDPVLISFVTTLLKDCGIRHLVADQHMSILDGSIGAIPRRILVDETHHGQAVRVVGDAGLSHELKTVE